MSVFAISSSVCIIKWIEPYEQEIEEEVEDDNPFERFLIENNDRINEFRNICNYTDKELMGFLEFYYDPKRELNLLEKINSMILKADS